MGINKVDQKSIAYQILYFFVKIWHHIFFYQKIEISHQDRIPKEGPVIITPNHQNALMDALALLFSLKRTIVFLARADMFKTKLIAEILYFLRILPVFRPRDGKGEVKKNQDTFDKTTEVLQKNYVLGIFPEGNHGDKHNLRALKKGFARIAFQTEEGNDYKMGIKIIPTGMLYSNYQNCQSVLSINFGYPISLEDFYEDYKTNPAVAYNKASIRLSEELKKYMIHIEDDEYYETIDFLQTLFGKEILRDSFESYSNRIESGMASVEKINKYKDTHAQQFEALHKTTSQFLAKSQTLNMIQKQLLVFWSWPTFLGQLLVFLVTFPILLISHFITLLPVSISLFVTSKIKDPQFKSSIKFVVSLLSFPIFFLIELSIFNSLCYYPTYYFFIGFTISVLISSQTAGWVRRFFGRFKLFTFWMFHSRPFKILQETISEIKESIKPI